MATAIVTPKTQLASLKDLIASSKKKLILYCAGQLDPQQFALACLDCLKSDGRLFDAAVRNPSSLIQSMCIAAKLGLSIGGGPAAEGYLIPYAGSVTFVAGYQGLCELIYRTGRVVPLNRGVIYADELYEYSSEPPMIRHTQSPKANKGEIVAAYAVLRMIACPTIPGISWLWRHQLDAIKDAAPGAKRAESPWNTHFSAMATKSAVRAGFSIWPKSRRITAAINLPDPDFDREERDPAIAAHILDEDWGDDAAAIGEPEDAGTGITPVQSTPRPSTDVHANLRAKVRDLAADVGNDRAEEVLGAVGIESLREVTTCPPAVLESAVTALQEEKMHQLSDRPKSHAKGGAVKQPELIPGNREVNP